MYACPIQTFELGLTSTRHSLRRAALRAVYLQPARTVTSLQCRAAFPSFSIQIARPAYRSFHQTKTWSNEQKGDADQEIVEKSIATPEVADAAEESSSQQSTTEAVTEKAQEFASAAVDTVRNVVSSRSASRGPDHVAVSPSTLYIGNVSFDATADQIKAHFSKFGQILKSRMVTDGRGLSKGFGFVEFANEDDAQRAIEEQNNRPFQGREMVVQIHQPGSSAASRSGADAFGRASRRAPVMTGPTSTLFIGNMSYQMSDRDLNGAEQQLYVTHHFR